jgi:3-oxoacyl-[acyl-carrier protein] reductase
MKKIIITGASGDFGQSFARYLAQEGYHLVLLSRTQEDLDNVKKSLPKSDQKIEVETLTINYSQASSLQAERLQPCHKADGIVLITPRPAIRNNLFPTPAEWEQLFQDCFIGPLELLKNTIPLLNKPAKIVIISGIASVQYMAEHSAYGVLRTMWLAQAKAMSYELGPESISVNSISPGGILTEKGIAKMQDRATLNHRTFEQQYEKSVDNVPLRKYAKPEELASVVEFYLSDKSNHITGTNVLFDGGYTKAY